MIKTIFSSSTKKILVYSALYFITFGIIISVFILTPETKQDFPILRGFIIFFASILLTKYFIYMLVSPWDSIKTAYKRRKLKNKIEQYKPLVSVMIPAWNEEFGILNTVETLLQSTYTNLELIIINDGSTDNSDALIKNFLRNYAKTDNPIKIIYRYKENGGKGAALNTAIKISNGEILMSIDADCAVDKHAVLNFVKCFADGNVSAAVGNVKIGNTKSIIGTIQQLEFMFSFYFKKADSFMNTIYIIGGAAGAFRREVFEKVGVYNTKNITEDIDLSVRIQDAGMRIAYVEDAVVYTEGASDIGGLMKQRLRWKRGRFETFKDNKQLFFSTEDRHVKMLTMIVLPLAYFGELQLSLELFFVGFLYIYSLWTHDFSSFISGIIVVGSMFFVQGFFAKEKNKKLSFYLLMPIGWLLFYVATFVELNALVRSVWGLMRKQEVKWQKWQRKGVNG